MNRILSLALCALFVFMMGTAAAAELPKDKFITISDLHKLCTETNGGNGLLSMGTDGDVMLRINFGRRPSDEKYYIDSLYRTAGEGPITWLLAGADEQGLVFFSEEPLLGCSYLNLDNTTVFSQNNINLWKDSLLRSTLQGLAENGSYFSSLEQAQMGESTLNEGSSYAANDVLYAPAAKFQEEKFSVGCNDHLAIDNNYWTGNIWMRSPDEDFQGYAMMAANGRILSAATSDPRLSVSGAFRLNDDALLFASAANAAIAADGKHTIESGAPMTLRVCPPESFGEVLVSGDGLAIYANAEQGTRLMIQGENWFYSKMLTGSRLFSAGDIDPSLTSFLDCKIWLEKDIPDGGSLTYAQPAQIDDDFDWQAAGNVTPPETGDGANLVLWTALLAISAVGMAIMQRKKEV